MNLFLGWSAEAWFDPPQQGHAVVEQVDAVNHRQTSPGEFRIAPEDRELLAILRIRRFCMSYQVGHVFRRLRAIQQQPDVDVAVYLAESAVREAAEFVGFDEK